MAELKAKPLPAELNHALRGGMTVFISLPGDSFDYGSLAVFRRANLTP